MAKDLEELAKQGSAICSLIQKQELYQAAFLVDLLEKDVPKSAFYAGLAVGFAKVLDGYSSKPDSKEFLKSKELIQRLVDYFSEKSKYLKSEEVPGEASDEE